MSKEMSDDTENEDFAFLNLDRNKILRGTLLRLLANVKGATRFGHHLHTLAHLQLPGRQISRHLVADLTVCNQDIAPGGAADWDPGKKFTQEMVPKERARLGGQSSFSGKWT